MAFGLLGGWSVTGGSKTRLDGVAGSQLVYEIVIEYFIHAF
jgi:hypothetical protein